MPNKLTTSEFVDRAKKVHGEEQYDYGRVVYEGSNIPVLIVCKDHGEFLQVPRIHLSGTSCPSCAKARGSARASLTTEEFIERAKLKHGGKYDYSEVHYAGNTVFVSIICPEHGLFRQKPCGHLNGNGCSKCGKHHMSRSKAPRTLRTNESILSDLKRVHGDKYDLGEVIYKNTRTKIRLLCREHGSFDILPKNAIGLKQGCPQCGRLRATLCKTKTSEEYIAACRLVHGLSYDYSDVTYKGSATAVKIICPLHGAFHQEAHTHLRGHGCAECARCKPLTTKVFIQKSVVIHNDRYDYSETIYTKNHEKVRYRCPEHGMIEQTALSHLAGKGCWKCFTKGFSKAAIAWLEYVAVRDGVFIEHALNAGEHQIRNSKYKADGYDPDSGKVYEFLGSYHHCEPSVYARDVFHTLKKKLCGEIYDETMERLEFIKAQGYEVEVIWESEWKAMKMAAKRICNAWRAYKMRRSIK